MSKNHFKLSFCLITIFTLISCGISNEKPRDQEQSSVQIAGQCPIGTKRAYTVDFNGRWVPKFRCTDYGPRIVCNDYNIKRTCHWEKRCVKWKPVCL